MPATFERELWAGVLCVGEPCAVGGMAALNKLGIGQQADEIVIVIPPEPPRRIGHPYRLLRDGRQRLAHRRGTLPIIRVEDALLDVSGSLSLEQFVGLVTDAARLARTSPKSIERVLRLRERQHNKCELLEVLTDLQGIESNLEYVFRRDVERAHGLPPAVRQARKPASRFDMLYEDFGVVAEVDGKRGHLERRFRDFRRDNTHAVDLLTTLRYGSYDIRSEPCLLARQLGRALNVRGWQDSIHACPACAGWPSQWM